MVGGNFVMRNGLTTILVLMTYQLFAQNLVPNSGFDVLVDCPTDIAQIFLAEPWLTASNGTPDLYNECSSEPLMTVPNAGRYLDSYQIPRNGSGYASILVYNNNNAASGSYGNSEYLEVQLLQPMKQGGQYYLEFYVSPDFKAGYTDAVGMALTDTFYFETLSAMEALSLNPVIEKKGTVIKDTMGWTKISGCHMANGGEQYAIIGNFNTTDETMVEFDSPSFPFVSYFYIDDVLITPFDPLPDTLLLCDAIPEELNAQFLDATYLWNTGETDAVITASASGEYSVEVFMENCTLRDTVIVIDTREAPNFPVDTIICQDEPLHLVSPLSGEYVWSDGSQGDEITVLESGNYDLSVTNECGEFVFSTSVEVEDCMCDVYVPNAFSPNGDGINDFLEVFVGCDFDYQIIRFEVFDRWGAKIYSAKNSEVVKWDGLYRQKLLNNGVYVWYLEYDIIRNGIPEKRIKKGDVTILK
jgi:gliding motility-associated-like protein